MQAIQIAMLSCVLSLVPTLIWGSIFLYKHNEKRVLLVKTYVYGACMVLPLIFYRYSFQSFESQEFVFGLISNSVLVLFLTIGFLEEFLKHLATRFTDQDEIQTIDDAIEFSIVGALGFAFAENTFYFIEVYQALGKEVFYQTIVLRSLFATFAHAFFSSIYGLYYGRQLFSANIYNHMPVNNSQKKFLKTISRILKKLTPKQLFKKQMRFYGLFLAGITHTAYNVLLEMEFVHFLIPFMVIGFYIILNMIWSSKNHVQYKVID